MTSTHPLVEDRERGRKRTRDHVPRRKTGTSDPTADATLQSWPTRWDGKTLPYVPQPIAMLHGRCSAVRLYWRHPDSSAVRVCVPDHNGAYTQLVAGQAYFEAPWLVTPIEALPPPPAVRHQSTQVDWADVPVPPEAHLVCFLPAS